MRHALHLALLLTLSGLLSACSTVVEDKAEPSILTEAYLTPGGTLLPKGTVLTDAVDATGRPFIRFRLPEGYKLVSAAPSTGGEAVLLADEGGITCTCTRGQGCSPFKAVGPQGTVVGCTMKETCTECTQKTNALVQKGGKETIADGEADILHLAAGVSFVLGPDELDSLSCPKDVVFAWEGFRRALTTFLDAFQLNNVEALRAATRREELPSNYTMLFVSVYGKVLRVPIERGLTISEQVSAAFFASAGRTVQPEEAEDGGACRCLSGPSGCLYERKKIPFTDYYAEWCEAGACASCRLEY